MKTLAIAATALILASGSAMAAQGPGETGHRYAKPPAHSFQMRDFNHGKLFRIRQARAHLAFVRHRAWADGRVTFIERIRIREAERRLFRLINR